ncbi:MAG: hypothetical protein ACPIOQ_58370, partial [Promethearchaeia archaeon]
RLQMQNNHDGVTPKIVMKSEAAAQAAASQRSHGSRSGRGRGHRAAASVRAQVGSWSADHKWSEQLGRDSYKRSLSTMDKLRAIPAGFKIAKGTSKLGWGGSEEFMTDDAFKVASNQGDVFNPIYGMTPPPINKGYLDEIEEAQGLQAQETADNGALAMGEEITGKTYYTNDTFWREGPAGSYGYMHGGAYYH